LRWLLTEYNSSPQFKALAKTTQQGYRGYYDVLCRKALKNGGSFGDVPLKAINRRTIRRYLDSNPYPVTANRHVQYIKAAWNWGLQRYATVPDPNPCLGVDLNKEEARDRYVTDEEYTIGYSVAKSMRVPYFAPAMELAYLCRARRVEVFGLTEDDCLPEGIHLRRTKGSRGEIVRWVPRLQAAIAACRSIYPNAPPYRGKRFLIHDKAGKPYTKNALDSAWQRIIHKAMDPEKTQPTLKEAFHFHDLKAKGITDSKRFNAGGHRTKKMEAVYNRLPEIVTLDYG
jgi:integrase